MIKFKPLFVFIALTIGSSLTSCVRNVSFDQADEIELQPEVELDLIYFQLNTGNFVDLINGQVIETEVSERTVLDFLNDDFFQDNLQGLTFYFQVENTFPQPFTTIIEFKSTTGTVKHKMEFTAEASPDGSPVLTTFEENLEGDELNGIKASIAVEVTASIDQNGQPIGGNLDFQSKVGYRLVF